MFPKNFLWGTSTSAYQVEGQNQNNDWWYWERKRSKKECGKACNHYELFEKDFDLAAQLGHNAHRFSIEWSRIEPKENQFDQNEIKHYHRVLNALLERKIEPIVTLHHFTNPKWIFDKGGWLNKDTVNYFLRYAEKVVSLLGEKVKYWITINEPMVLVHSSYIIGIWPAEQKSLIKAWKVTSNLISAHKKTYQKIHEIYRDKNYTHPLVSIAKHFHLFLPCNYGIRPLNNLAIFLRNRSFNFYILEQIRNFMDFIGLNYYTRDYAEFNFLNIKELFGKDCTHLHHHTKKMNSIGWNIDPKGILEVLKILKKFNLPILITENGICTEDDNQRWSFIYEHIEQIKKALDLNIPVIGYLYWSLIDNFEWEKGFSPRFGLIEVDYSNFNRKIRKSAKKFAEFIKSQNRSYI
jgi:beta-glucosidase